MLRASYLEVHENVHDVVIHLLSNSAFRPPGQEHELNAKQRHQDKGRSHSFHVEMGFCLVRDF